MAARHKFSSFHIHIYSTVQAKTRRSANAGTMLGQRQSRWSNIVPTLVERLVFAGILVFDKMALGLQWLGLSASILYK